MIDYSDYVRVAADAPPRFEPGREGSVVSIWKVDTPSFARRNGVGIGTRMIGIESDDGSFVEAPEKYIIKLA